VDADSALGADAPLETSSAPPPIAIRKGTRVLMFGDSMVTSGLGIYLKERVVALGGTFVPVSKGSSTTLSWREGPELQELITRTRPDVVIIALAANELFVPNPRERDAVSFLRFELAQARTPSRRHPPHAARRQGVGGRRVECLVLERVSR
jgi:hypothetical protein